MKTLWVAILFAIIAGNVMAEDFSVTLQRAKPWPGKKVWVAGMQSRTAPVGTVTAVRFWTRGWVTGTNSRPMTVWAVPRSEAFGIRWRIIGVKAYCSNPAVGEWLECLPKPAPKPCPPAGLNASVESELPPRETETTVTNCFKANPMPGMVGGREVDSGISVQYGTEDVQEIFPEVSIGTEIRGKSKTSPYCPPGGKPGDPPPPGQTVGGSQPPPQNNHGTAGQPHDPTPMNPHVADPVH